MKFTVRFTALFTALTMLFAIAASALEVQGIGTITENTVTQLADFATLTSNTLTHTTAGQQAERYIEWKTGGQLTPMVVGGDSIYGGALTLDAATEKLTALGYDVAAGLNGDFFTLATGIPQGILVTDGILRTSDSGVSAVGFQNDGQVFIARPSLKFTFTYNNISYVIDKLNKPRLSAGLFLYTSDFGPTTVAATQGTSVVLEAADGLRVGQTLSAKVVAIHNGTEPVELKEGQLCLSAEDTSVIPRISQLKVGSEITFTVSGYDKRFEKCSYVIGAYHPLIENGSIVAGLEATRAPRTAIGIKADGTVVFYGVDGRQSGYSVGLSLSELAARMRSLGCVSAIEMDGGASTDMAARLPGTATPTRLGKPSDGVPRKCSNFIMFVNNTERTGVTKEFFFKPKALVTLAGAELDITKNISVIDSNYHPMSLPAELSWSVSNGLACIVSPFGIVSALEEGKSSVIVSDPFSGAVGELDIEIVGQPDSIKLVNAVTGKAVTDLNIDLYETVQLKAIGVVNGVDIEGGRFEWFTQDSAVASVDQLGNVLAGGTYGSVTRLIVGMGNCLYSVFITVGKSPVVLTDFENVGAALFAGATVGTGYSRENRKDNVKFGLFAGAFSYDFQIAAEGASVLTFNANVTFPERTPYLSMWLKGDGSGNRLSMSATDAAGNPTEIPLATLDFTDYRQIIIPLTPEIYKITGFKLIRMTNAATSGTFHLDQMTLVFTEEPDTTPPAVSILLRAEAGVLEITGEAIDYNAALLLRDNVSLALDGESVPFSFESATGQIKATIPMPDEGYHKLTLKAGDIAGNYSITSRAIDQPTHLREGASFADINGHWSMPLVELLDRKGVFPVAASEDGKRYFNPDEFITRADVAVYMSKTLKLDESKWASVVLPYADLEEIPEEAIGAVKALYGNGYMMGQTYEGSLIFGPNTSLTRAESFAVIGRAIPKGLTVSAFTAYADAAEIPAYAAMYVELLAGLGIINDAAIAQKVNPNNAVTRAEFSKMLSLVR